VCVCVCVCVRERERERELAKGGTPATVLFLGYIKFRSGGGNLYLPRAQKLATSDYAR